MFVKFTAFNRLNQKHIIHFCISTIIMTNKEVANVFNTLGKIMELHGENPFKTRSYSSAYINIRKLPFPVVEKSKEELQTYPGIGKAIADKIIELKETGELFTLNKYLEKTPPGVVQLLGMKGFGPKKIKAVWEQLNIESPGELLYACHENRLVELKGFGAKTQASLIDQLTYFMDSQGKYLFGHVIQEGIELLGILRDKFQSDRFEFTRTIQRKMPVVDGIEILTTADEEGINKELSTLSEVELSEGSYYFKGTKVIIYQSTEDYYNDALFLYSGSDEFISSWQEEYDIPDDGGLSSDSFKALDLAYIPPEARESANILQEAEETDDLQLIVQEDIRGVVHTHSVYSDGTNTVKEMAEASQSAGYEYLVMSDHSKAAFYANGLDEDRVLQQMREIDQLNKEMSNFRVFKSIECDILYDGSLDYDDEFLQRFELVIASVHSNLKMPIDKATDRILKAVSHPATRILGHPTGRLLLSREGYPIDHEKIIDACADHGVSIEINASPYRLDLDWSWIDYARFKGVLLSINPDAHSIAGIKDIEFGVIAARKGGLRAAECLNAKTLSEFEQWINK